MANYVSSKTLITDGTITLSTSITTGKVTNGVHGGPATLAWLPTQAGTVSLTFAYRASWDDGTTWSDYVNLGTSAADGEFANTTLLWNAMLVSLVDAPAYEFKVTETGGANNVTDLELVIMVSEDV